MAESTESIRIRLPAGGDPTLAVTCGAGPKFAGNFSNVIPLKEWCINDDVLNVADTASFTVSNIDGANRDRFRVGQRVEIELADDEVSGGAWTRVFTGRVVRRRLGSDLSSGSVILVECMDLGWHLTSCCGRPLQGTNGITLDKLCENLLESTWGIKSKATVGNLLNRKLKQGRAGVLRSLPRDPTQVLPPIQVEPGQTPWQVFELYFHREGFLLNIGAEGDLVIFQPDYASASPYGALEYHGSTDGNRNRNNIEGHPTLTEDIEGVYSEAQCWSTVVVPTPPEEAAIARNPNAQYKWTIYKPSVNPLPFDRRHVAVDSEAINGEMRKNRAVYAYQMGAFNSWVYECDVNRHTSKAPGSREATFWATDAVVSVRDSIHGVDEKVFIQGVRKSMTQRDGSKTHLTLRKANLLDPSLQAIPTGKSKKAAVK